MNPGGDQAGVCRRGPGAQRVAVCVLKEVRNRSGSTGTPPGDRQVIGDPPVSSRRRVGLAGADVRPRAFALVLAHGPHLHLVDRAGVQVRQVQAPRRGVQRAAVRGPLGGALLAVLRPIAGYGVDAIGGSRPGHVQRRFRRLAELGARGRRRAGLARRGHVIHREEYGDERGMSIDRVVHLAPVELGMHLALPVLDFPVGIIRLIVQRRALPETDLAAGRVDDEFAGVGRLALQGVGERLAVVRGSSHRTAHQRSAGGVLGHASTRLVIAPDRPGEREVSAESVMHAEGKARRARIQNGCGQPAVAGFTGYGDVQQCGMLCRAP